MRKSNIKKAARYFPARKPKTVDTVRDRKASGTNIHVLTDAFNAWSALDLFRQKCERNKMYVFGDQWGDKVWDGCKWITERESIIRQGNLPVTNNRIRSILRSVTGVFQSNRTEPVCVARDRDEQDRGEVMSAALQYVYQLNRLWGLDSDNFRQFLITGLAAFRSNFGWRNGKMDVWTDAVSHNRIFFDSHMNDTRLWDCHLIGEIHDVGIYDLIARFADGSREKAEYIRELYGRRDDEQTIGDLSRTLEEDLTRHRDFFIPDDPVRCRVIEVWKMESKERLLVHDRLTGDFYRAELTEEPNLKAENLRRIETQDAAGIRPEDRKLIEYRWIVDNYWYYYFLTPAGDVLAEGETPFWHGGHPYAFRIYPFYDGQVYPFVADFIDQQRLINRLVMMQDFVTRASAKGVLLVHKDSKPEGVDINTFVQAWHAYNGVIEYDGKPGTPLPQQVVSNVSQLGVTDMLSVQLKLLEDVSGVQGALQGKTPAAGTPAALYMQQTQNSTTALTEIFEAYRELREERDAKNMKLIQQYYTEPRYISLVGNRSSRESMMYDPERVRNAEFDLSITESASTPAYRMIMNDFLMQLFQTGQVTLAELLENGAFPFADKLLQSVKSRQQAMTEGGDLSQPMVPPDIARAIQQQTAPEIKNV
jgi:hypothetical protein